MKTINLMILATFVLCIMTSSVLATANPWTIDQVTSSENSNARVDIAVGSNDIVYRVYERNNQIFYSDSLYNTESLVGDGTNPAIAVGPNNLPQIVYLYNGNWVYAVKNDDSWDKTTQTNAGIVDISVDKNNKAHVVILGNYDGDGYAEVVFTDNIAGTWAEPTIFADGYFEYGSGNYFHNPSIAVDNDGFVHFSMQDQSWQGNARDSADYAYVYTTASVGTAISSDFGYNSVSVGVNSIGLDNNGHTFMMYSQGGNMYLGIIDGNVWHNKLIGQGSYPTLNVKDDKIAIVYTDANGNVMYTDATVPSDYPTTDLSFSIPSYVDAGTYPVVSLGSKTIDYINTANNVQQVFEAYQDRDSSSGGNDGGSDTVPEFGIIAGAVALIGAIGIVAYKRKN